MLLTVVMLAAFLIMMALGISIGGSMILASAMWLVLSQGFDIISVASQRIFAGVTPFPLLAVPFFILTGTLMNRGGVTQKIFRFVTYLSGGVRGGLAHANVLASMVFAGMSGSAVADAAGLGLIEIRAMEDAKYDRGFAAAVTACSSALGPIIPPSIPLVLYGTMIGVSVGKLFLGGLVPGLLLGGFMMATIVVVARKRGYEVSPRVPFRQTLKAGIEALPAMFVPLLILGGILLGVFTPTEAAVVAAAYSAFIARFVYRELDLKSFVAALRETVEHTAKVMFIVGAAGLFGWVLAFNGIPQLVTSTLLGITGSTTGILVIAALIFVILGCFMETNAIILLTVPIFAPIMQQVGIDPIFFGVFMTFLLMLGVVTPPVGICLYPVANIARVPLMVVVKESLPFYVAFFVVAVLMLLFPQIISFVPNMLVR